MIAHPIGCPTLNPTPIGYRVWGNRGRIPLPGPTHPLMVQVSCCVSSYDQIQTHGLYDARSLGFGAKR